MSKFVFITDTHFTSSSNVRAGDLHKDQIDKLRWVVDFANKENATLLHSGDFFDKPSVPDFVKSSVIEELKRLNNGCLAISGNHDWLYGSDEREYRTSFNVLVTSGVVEKLIEKELDDVVLTSRLPLLDREKPQILLFHGFLNQEDGLCTLRFQDLSCDTESLVLLGHDHVPYQDETYKGSTIVRAGSFTRGVRNDSAERIPQALLIEVRDGRIFHSYHDIETAKQVEFLFKSKQNKVEKTDISYSSIIEQIKGASKSKDNLSEALKLVTDDMTVSYIEESINEYNLKNQK